MGDLAKKNMMMICRLRVARCENQLSIFVKKMEESLSVFIPPPLQL